MKNIITLFFILIVIKETSVLAQLEITGRVVNDKNEPIAGANIIVKGKIIGTISNFNGNFSLKISVDSAVLSVSSIGYSTRLIKVKENKNIEIKLHVVVDDQDFWVKRGDKPISIEKNKEGSITLYATGIELLENNKPTGKFAVWQIGNYRAFLPFDSLRKFLEYAGYNEDILFGLEYLKSKSKKDTVFLSKKFVKKIGERNLNDFAIEMIKAKSIVVANKNNMLVKSLIVKDIMWNGTQCKNCCWGAILFVVGEEETTLFSITTFLC